MYCMNCGKEIKDGSKFCNECGADISKFQNIELEYEAIECTNQINTLTTKVHHHKIISIIALCLSILSIIVSCSNSYHSSEPTVNTSNTPESIKSIETPEDTEEFTFIKEDTSNVIEPESIIEETSKIIETEEVTTKKKEETTSPITTTLTLIDDSNFKYTMAITKKVGFSTSYEIKINVENKTNYNYSFRWDNECINEYSISSIFIYTEVAPNKKAVDTEDIYAYTLSECGISKIHTVEFDLCIYNQDTWNTYATKHFIINVGTINSAGQYELSK